MIDGMMEAKGHKRVGQGVRLTIYGEPVSMKNSRKIVRFGNRPALIKSDAGRSYENDVIAQVKTLPTLLTKDLSVIAHAYYKTKRKDLDIELLFDCLQGRIYQNDRQIKEKHIYWHLDKKSPRVEIEIKEVANGLEMSEL